MRYPGIRVEAVERGCAAAEFYVMDDGRVGGRVLDAEGKPVPGVSLTLMEVGDGPPLFVGAKHAQADAHGQLEIKARVGTTVQIHARTLVPYAGDPAGTGGTLVRSEPQTLSVANPVETVTLVITKSK